MTALNCTESNLSDMFLFNLEWRIFVIPGYREADAVIKLFFRLNLFLCFVLIRVIIQKDASHKCVDRFILCDFTYTLLHFNRKSRLFLCADKYQ